MNEGFVINRVFKSLWFASDFKLQGEGRQVELNW